MKNRFEYGLIEAEDFIKKAVPQSLKISAK